jgi:Fic family protein
LPNPGLLIAPALAREAVDTSWLEGTIGALADVLEARLSETRPRSAEVAEIRAYERAAHQGFEIARHRPIKISWLADLQGVLAAEAREPQRDPGRVRGHQVAIAARDSSVYSARFVPPPPDDRLRAGLDDWEMWVNEGPDLPPPLKAAMAHYQFETLHPFGDGNGRVGRLVIVLQLLRAGAISEPAITISPWLRKRRSEYQDHLLSVSMTGDWRPWVQFFCAGLAEQARTQASAVEQINGWLDKTRGEVNARHWSGTLASILVDLIEWPVITTRFVRDKYDVSAPTAKNVIDRLLEIEAIEEIDRRGASRVYAATEIIRIVEDL